MLIKCSETGQVLWMSPVASATLGEARNLTDTVVAATRKSASGPSYQARPRHLPFSHLRRGGWTAAQRASAWTGDGDRRSVGTGRVLEGDDLRRFSRLEQTARKLVERSRQRQAGAPVPLSSLIEEERARLGRNCIPEWGNCWSASCARRRLAEAQLPAGESEASHTLGRISAAASEALALVRSVSARLHPPEWQRLTLEAALEQLWQISGIPQRYQAELSLAAPPAETEPVDQGAVLSRGAGGSLQYRPAFPRYPRSPDARGRRRTDRTDHVG